jgi:hypothetical protein
MRSHVSLTARKGSFSLKQMKLDFKEQRIGLPMSMVHQSPSKNNSRIGKEMETKKSK